MSSIIQAAIDDAGHPPVGAAPPTIFVIDDDEGVRDSLLVLLQVDGFEAFGFESCAAALSVLRTVEPAALILDLHLPVTGGLEFLRQLQERGTALPVVLISGHIDRRTRERALALGVDAIFEKPLNAAKLLEEIRRLCRGP